MGLKACVPIIVGLSLAVLGVPGGSAHAIAPSAPGDPTSGQQAKRVPDGAAVAFYVGLKRPEQAAASTAKSVSDPTSAQYRHFPGRDQIRQQFGASEQTVQEVTKAAAQHHMKAEVDPTGVYATISGEAGDMAAWLGGPVMQAPPIIPLTQSGIAYQRGVDTTAVPSDLKPLVTELVPNSYTYKYATLQLSGVLVDGFLTQPTSAPENTGTPDSCISRDHPELSAITYSFNQLRAAYGIDALGTGSDVGGATRMAIMSGGSGFSDADLTASAECFGLPTASFERVASPGLTGPLPVGDEGGLDTQVAQAVLPEGSHVTVVERGAFEHPFRAWSTVFALPTQADVVSSSYGTCEQLYDTYWGQGAAAITDAVLLRVAMAGTSVFASSGDSGSSDCGGPKGVVKKLSVNHIASSPYVTSVGGSRLSLNADNNRAGEVVWNDTQVPQFPQAETPLGGGGGSSIWFPQPWWQQGADTRSKMRTEPDLVAHASGIPGWPLTWDGSVSSGSGTSASSPFVASAFAVMAAQERLAGRPPLGPVQPWLYALHRQQPSSFYDVVSGSNDLYRLGCCDARPGYDQASGLGVPNLPVIAGNVPPPGQTPGQTP